VERAGHNPHFEQTEEVMNAVRDFVTDPHPQRILLTPGSRSNSQPTK
jgi:hypothetical protein